MPEAAMVTQVDDHWNNRSIVNDSIQLEKCLLLFCWLRASPCHYCLYLEYPY